MIDKENMTVTCDVCGRTEKIDFSESPTFNFVMGVNGTRYETVGKDNVCERCYKIDDNKVEGEIRS